MTYTKPLILITNRAASAIQGMGKSDKTTFDGSHLPATVPAYEADE